MADVLTSILHELFITIAADEIRDFFARIFSGEDFFALLQGGNEVATALVDGFASAGIDPNSLTDQQWGELASLVLPTA